MQTQIKDTSVCVPGGILGSDPAPHILPTEIFSVWRMELELRPVLCLDKRKKNHCPPNSHNRVFEFVQHLRQGRSCFYY